MCSAHNSNGDIDIITDYYYYDIIIIYYRITTVIARFAILLLTSITL